jgi:hypothetical protein
MIIPALYDMLPFRLVRDYMSTTFATTYPIITTADKSSNLATNLIESNEKLVLGNG